jgi:hypothetical protein
MDRRRHSGDDVLKKNGKKGLIAAMIVAVTLLAGRRLGTASAFATATAVDGSIIRNTDLYIYDPAGTRLLGRAHYTVKQHDNIVTIEGRNDFLDGEYDIEHDTLKMTADELPRMIAYEHSFFDAHGAPQIIAKADAVTGKTSCAKYEKGEGTIETALLQFPPDTYAGAGVLVPVADQFRRGNATDLDLHVFDCAHGPRILTLHVDLERAPWHFLPHDGELGKADAQPVFGWFNIFLKPFVPTIRMWFDPLRDFAFVGGMLSRYYRGPEVLLVRMTPPVKAPPVLEPAAAPALTAPHDSPDPKSPTERPATAPASVAVSAAIQPGAAGSTPTHIDPVPAAH